ncbi:hypothetical protein CEXT_261561 [Caerostris extrusa]|uniref:Uncharacterized protein n=1 Tax=Caerostris extrusa TaxID=172846 RepID=A0AAV4SND8_CAEEX|nr:hypothetical protein CEXT_261561 [Caerostris extrusa]
MEKSLQKIDNSTYYAGNASGKLAGGKQGTRTKIEIPLQSYSNDYEARTPKAVLKSSFMYFSVYIDF